MITLILGLVVGSLPGLVTLGLFVAMERDRR